MMDVVASFLGATSVGQSAQHIQSKVMRFVFLPTFLLLLSSRSYVTPTDQTASTEPLQSSSTLEEEIIFTEATDVIFSSTMFIQPSSTTELIHSSINDSQQIMTSSNQMYSSPFSVETSSLLWESSVHSMANSSLPFMETASSEAIMVSSSEYMVISSEFSEIIIASSSMELPLPSMSALPSVFPTTNTTAAPPQAATSANLGLILGVTLGVGIPVLVIIVLLLGFCVRMGGVSQSMTSIKKAVRPKARSYDMYDDFTVGNNVTMQHRAPSNGDFPNYAYDNNAYGTTKLRA